MSPGDEAGFAAGTVVARYRVLAPLGRGAMGLVLRAQDLELGREVALKLLPGDAAEDPEHRERLLREARNASRLNHPGICTVHEVGRADGRTFIAMELVAGQSLQAVIPPGGLPASTVASYGAQIARALDHAHAHGVLHRDLKPSNVMVTPDGRTKLLDFGLSRAAVDEAAAARGEPVGAATSTGVVAGTPQYLAPELLEGGRSSVASEVWALGVLLYEMCAGTPPFGGPRVGAIVAAILQGAPQPLPEHVPPALRAVVARCLDQDPARRWSSAAEVASALEALGSAGGPPTRGPRRHRFRLGLALGVLVAAAALIGWRLWAPGAADRSLERTVLVLPMEMRGASADPRFAGRAFAEALAIALAQHRRLRVMPVPAVGEVGGRGTLDRARAALALGAGRLVLGSLTREGDSLRASVSLLDTRQNEVLWGEERAVHEADLAPLATAVAGHLADELGARPLRRYDYFMYVTGPPAMAASPDLAEALGAVRRYEVPQALAATARLVARFPREPDAHVLRGVALLTREVLAGPDAASGREAEDELAALRRLDPHNPWPDVGAALRAVNPAQRAEVLARVARRDDLTPAARGFVLATRADALLAGGDTTGAAADAAEAVRLDPASDLSLSTEARVMSARGRYAEAAARVRQAIALNPTVANYWHQLGNCVLKQGRWADYAADLDHVAALRPGDPIIPSAQCDGLGALGRHAEAAEAARRALALQPQAWLPSLQLGLELERLGAWEEALPLLRRAAGGGPPANRGIATAAAAVVRWRAGDRRGAEALERQAATEAAGKSATYALACARVLAGDRAAALGLLERYPERTWVEPALARDPNLAALRGEPRFRRLVAWTEAQPIARRFADWGRSR